MAVDRDKRAGVALILVGSIVSFAAGILLVGFGLYFSGLVGGPSFAFGWAAMVLGAVSVGGGEVGLSAYRLARGRRFRAAFIRALIASMLPPVQLVLLIGALLCREPAAEGDLVSEADENPFV
jgi:hypothetical protein